MEDNINHWDGSAALLLSQILYQLPNQVKEITAEYTNVDLYYRVNSMYDEIMYPDIRDKIQGLLDDPIVRKVMVRLLRPVVEFSRLFGKAKNKSTKQWLLVVHTLHGNRMDTMLNIAAGLHPQANEEQGVPALALKMVALRARLTGVVEMDGVAAANAVPPTASFSPPPPSEPTGSAPEPVGPLSPSRVEMQDGQGTDSMRKELKKAVNKD